MDDNNKKQFDFDTPENVTKTYKEVEIPIETKAEKTKRITVKCLIWFFSIILINAFIVVCNVFGITLGGIPIAIIYVLGFVGIKKLTKSWDEHCYYNTSLDEESREQIQITEPTQINVEIPDTPKKTQETSLKSEKTAQKNEYKEKLNILKSKNNKNNYKIATIILSVVLALSLSITIVLAVNITNLTTENSELKLENENLQYQLDNNQELSVSRMVEINELKDEIREKDKKYLSKVFFLDTKIAFIDVDDNYYYHTYDCPDFKDSDSYYAHNLEYAISQGYAKHSCW